MTQLRFYNVWEAESADKRDELIAVMRDDVTMFADRPGFVSLHAWVSETGHRVVVEGNWASRQDFDAAVSANPEARAQRQRMENLATAAPAVYALAFSQLPGHSDPQPSGQEHGHE